MKKILKALVPLFLLVLPTGSYAHNILRLDVDSITNSDIFIRQVETHLEMWGTSSGNNFQIVGDNISVNIDMQSTDSGCCNYVTGGFISNSNSSLIIKFSEHGSDHLVNLDYDYSGTSNYHNVDVEISGTGHTNKVYIDDDGVDHSNTSLEIDIKGSGGGNHVYATVGGTQAAQKIYIDGYSNRVYSWHNGVGDLTTGQTSLSTLDSTAYANYIYMTGHSNYVKVKTIGTSKTKIVIDGNSNKVTEFEDRDDWMLNTGGTVTIDINGNSNFIGVYQIGSSNVLTMDIDTSGIEYDIYQHGSSNSADITVCGSSIHNFRLDVTQSGSQTFVYVRNLDDMTSSTTNPMTNPSSATYGSCG